ncbi:hypothetical protein [Phyllobacterium myrsinacearum]|nr:hypothetical protein [Phyllobacterium myrsinacearum]PWV86539.1 hypothetical protein DEV92_11621 [Phyllobacterium myrsinacearum]RZS76681.1 hypothetical protein EV217_4896 [Phyllobacterium myrsinacearum]RZU96890.1 hypothetical protein EV654_5074 [Phyllobacterium myrsinacearum]
MNNIELDIMVPTRELVSRCLLQPRSHNHLFQEHLFSHNRPYLAYLFNRFHPYQGCLWQQRRVKDWV